MLVSQCGSFPRGIVVIPANMPHRFVNSGKTPLRQINIHASPKFIQTNL
jgi:mannose-6-phosphate isomerase-like protein (cupin superfamily)